MSYLALYRKYRPNTFDMVIGQEHITTSLINQIKNDSISHAYLFCGTRGTGKTSVAKIFAKAINCENPVNGSPCGKCKTCEVLSNANNMDILEIDAASNNRVDEIRELREKVKYPPVNGKYKVYIVDEVHMLTDSAFNALLKTLEEPPKHVVFILATTETQKLPATILSRCLRFDFKLVGNDDLEKQVKYIFNDSKIKYEEPAISEIARLGEGSVRDTLSIADMCVAYSNRNVTYESVLSSIGAIDKTMLYNLAKIVLDGDVKCMLTEIDKIIRLGKNITQVAKDLSNYFRDLAVVKTCENFSDILKYPADILKGLEELSKPSKIDKILLALKTFSSLDNEFRYTNNPRIVLEVSAISLCRDMANNESLETRVENLEKSLVNPDKKTLAVSTRANSISTTNFDSINEKELHDVMKLNVLEDMSGKGNTLVYDQKFTSNEQTIFQKTLESFETYDVNDKSLFGKMMVNLRLNNEIILQALLINIKKYYKKDNKFMIVVKDEIEYQTISKPSNLKILNNILSEIENGLTLGISLQENFTEQKDIKSKLKDLFGDILEIS